MAKNVIKNPSRSLDIRADFATAAASKDPKNIMKTLLEVIISYRTGSALYLGKLVKFVLYKWNKNK